MKNLVPTTGQLKKLKYGKTSLKNIKIHLKKNQIKEKYFITSDLEKLKNQDDLRFRIRYYTTFRCFRLIKSNYFAGLSIFVNELCTICYQFRKFFV